MITRPVLNSYLRTIVQCTALGSDEESDCWNFEKPDGNCDIIYVFNDHVNIVHINRNDNNKSESNYFLSDLYFEETSLSLCKKEYVYKF